MKALSRKILIGFGLLLAVFLITACGSSRPAIPTITDSVSTVTKTVERDTTIAVPGATTSLIVTVAQLNKAIDFDLKNYKNSPPGHSLPPIPLGSSFNKQASTKATIQDGKLNIQCKCDTLGIIAKLKDKSSQTDRSRTATVTVQVRYIPWHIKGLAAVGAVALAAALIMVIVGVKRKFYS